MTGFVGILTAMDVENTIEVRMAHIKSELEGTLNTAQVMEMDPKFAAKISEKNPNHIAQRVRKIQDLINQYAALETQLNLA